MKNNLIGKRYAKALLEIAADNQKVDAFEKDVLTIKENYLNNKEFAQIIESKLITSEEKKKMVTDLWSGMLSEEILSFVSLIIDKHREESLSDILDSFLDLADQFRGISTIECYSANELSEDQKNDIVEKFSKVLNKTIKIETKIEKDLLGGLKVKYRDQVIDGSVINKLDQYENVLTK